MQGSHDDIPFLQGDLRELLDELCVEWGFCVPPEAYNEICRRSSLSAEEFASAVLQAEGMNPEYEKKWFRSPSNRFVETFGAFVSADKYGV
jgi:hypothetical protein